MMINTALAADAKKFFEPLWNFIDEGYFTKGKYPNLGLEKNALFSLEFSILAIVVGLILACLVIAYHKQISGKAVRTLIEKECSTPDTAKTLFELGIGKNIFVRNAVANDKALQKYIFCTEKEEYLKQAEEEQKKAAESGEKAKRVPEYLIDAKSAHFYIPEELAEDAGNRYRLKGSGAVATTLTVCGLLAVLAVLFFTLPDILMLINNLLG